ncbi:MAG: flagellar hook capping FlgD N-terminal domain-containing protein [Fibrobacterota bacterium]
MPTINQSVNAMQQSGDPYSVKAGITDKGLQTKEVTGDRESGNFADPKEQEMAQEEFLFLLTEQLKHQDPMDPMDNRDFVTQLAQFTELENSTNVKNSMDDMRSSLENSLDIQNNTAQSMSNASAVSLVGREVRLMQDSFSWEGNSNQPFRVQMGNRSSVTVEILDSDDEVIDEVTVDGKDDTNAGTFTWDGVTQEGEKAEFGEYKLRVRENAESSDELYCFVQDVVKGLRYTDSGAMLNVDNREISVGNIIEVEPGGFDKDTGTGGFETITMGQALNLVGKNIRTTANPRYTPSHGEKEVTYNVELNGDPGARVIVKDADGVIVQNREVSKSGEVTLPLTGSPDQDYSVSIEDSENAYFYMDSEVTGVKSTDSGIQLNAGGRLVDLRDIIELSSTS